MLTASECERLVEMRHHLHRHPELSCVEERTAAFVADRLRELGLPVATGIGGHGLVATVGREGPAVGLRADMDALAITELTGLPHASQAPGVMHACGHDGHMAILIGAATILQRQGVAGQVHLVFQHAEERYGGARMMLDAGLLDRFPMQRIFGLHNWPGLPVGKIAVRPGPMMAAADRVTIDIEGKGGHGAHPHQAVDPVLVAGHIITAAQSIVARNVSPIDTAVVSLCAMHAGHPGAMSVIPRTAQLVGTVRTFRSRTQDMIETRLTELVASIAAAFGASAKLAYERVYPATINSAREALFAAEVARTVVGRDNVIDDLDPSMGSEDFSFMLQARPGAYARLGQGGSGGGPACFLHDSRYDFNDEVIPIGAGYLAALAEQAMPLESGGAKR